MLTYIQTMKQLDERIAAGGDPGDWRLTAYRRLSQNVDQELFPCPFAKRSKERSSQYFAFVDALDAQGLERIRHTILEYLEITDPAQIPRPVLVPLLLMVKPESAPLALVEYHRQAWGILQYLHEHDQVPWPSQIPRDPQDTLWTFCFSGVQLFSNFSAPAHVERRARNLGDSLTLVINRRENFDIVAGDTPAGHGIRAMIRRRLEEYEGQPAPEDLGFYGDKNNLDWRQMAAAESDTPLPDRCPLRMKAGPT